DGDRPPNSSPLIDPCPCHAPMPLTGVIRCRIPHLSNWEGAGAPARGWAPQARSLGANNKNGRASRVDVSCNPKEAIVTYLTRRSVLRGSLALAAARPFVGPHVARAAATTASVWFAQGFVQDEDIALRKAVADYEKA